MSHAFISGIPASGKSYLAKKVATDLGIPHFSIDDWREELRQDKNLQQWVDFFWNQNEQEYWQTTSCDLQWKNLKNQSEALWPTIELKIKEIQKLHPSVIFEGVNILPHLATSLDFSGIVLLGESFEQILERIKQDVRWGETEELQQEEANAFWNCERGWYESESKTHGFKTFSNPLEAEEELLRILQS